MHVEYWTESEFSLPSRKLGMHIVLTQLLGHITVTQEFIVLDGSKTEVFAKYFK